ncbi:MAG: hypothetical protein HC915_16460 [Anaerolineae bacterium]|nr:hypothetical protein [Anaerolineae bacterium]
MQIGVAVLIMALLANAARQIQQSWPHFSFAQQALIGAASAQLMISGALLTQWMARVEAPFGRLLFPALVPVALLIVLGIPRRARPWLMAPGLPCPG